MRDHELPSRCHCQMSARQPLSRDRIVDAAMCYVDANCLDDLSMRRLGSELGVEAMSLYRYFPSKAALLDGVVCRALEPLRQPLSQTTDWREEVRTFARSFRRISREHPRLVPLLATMGPQNDVLARVTNRMVEVWRRTGLDEGTAQRAQTAVQGYVTGSSLWDGGDAITRDADFEFGLEALMRGLAETISESAAVSARR